MERRHLSLAVLFLLVCVCFCVYADASESVRTALPSHGTSLSVLPVDVALGQTASRDSSENHKALFEMLRQPYSFEWTQMYIAESVRPALVRLYGAWLSENLGKEDWLFSVSHANSDNSVGILARLGDSRMSFVLLDGQIVSMKDF